MAFIAGSANTVNELFTAFTNACTANGWTLASGILSKGDCYAKPFLNDGTIALLAGTGQNGSTLVNPPTLSSVSVVRVPGAPNIWVSLAGIDIAIAYPLTYFIHILDNPNEVYLFINHNVSKWSYIAFGQSPIENLTGLGVWYGGTGNGNNILPNGDVFNNGVDGHIACALFNYVQQSGTTVNGNQRIKCFFHHNLSDSPSEWSISGTDGVGVVATQSWTALPSQANATFTLMPLLTREPSVWNSGASLLPIQPSIIRPDNRRSIVGDLKHARYVRIDYIEPSQIVTLGGEKWRIYPWIQKNISDRNANGTENKLHSGTYGVAIRYDGD